MRRGLTFNRLGSARQVPVRERVDRRVKSPGESLPARRNRRRDRVDAGDGRWGIVDEAS